MHLHKVFTALLCNPSGFLKIAVAEGLGALAAVITRVMYGGKLFVYGFIYLYPARFNVLFQKIVYRDNLVLIESFGEPCLQTKPGRIIGVPSFGQEERLAVQPLHVIHDPPHQGLHGLIIS